MNRTIYKNRLTSIGRICYMVVHGLNLTVNVTSIIPRRGDLLKLFVCFRIVDEFSKPHLFPVSRAFPVEQPAGRSPSHSGNFRSGDFVRRVLQPFLWSSFILASIGSPKLLFAQPAHSQSSVQPAQTKPVQDGGPLLGAAWYPEQWPESRWESDLALMQKANMRVVRVGEFAWTALEPAEGKYELDWLDRAVALAGKHGLKVIMGTPSGAVPVWMEKKYLDIMTTDSSGKRYDGATRNHGNWNNARYRELVQEIDEKLARRFGRNPNVIGWQVDNEFSQQSYDADTQAQFHQWLRVRYGRIEKLNAAWTTAYDNQTYSDFNEVPLVEGNRGNSPGLWLDSKL
jgi:Beta-galactosidase